MPNGPLSHVLPSAFTAAVPPGNHTRLSIIPQRPWGQCGHLTLFLYASILFFAPRFVNSGGRYKKDRRIFEFASAVKAALEFTSLNKYIGGGSLTICAARSMLLSNRICIRVRIGAFGPLCENREPGVNPGRYRHCICGARASDESRPLGNREGFARALRHKSGDLLGWIGSLPCAIRGPTVRLAA